MNKRKTLTIYAAALAISLSLHGPASATDPTQEQVQAIQGFVAAGDFEALAEFLTTFPELLAAPTPFAQELASFVEAHTVGASFSFSPTTVTALERTVARTNGAMGGGASADAGASAY